jgi:hypothetical protein
MAKFTVESRAASGIANTKLSTKHTKMTFAAGEEIHFWDSIPVAVVSAGIVYHHAPSESAVTKMLHEIVPTAPHIREAADEFDFIVGQVLVKAGLPLTRRIPSESNNEK